MRWSMSVSLIALLLITGTVGFSRAQCVPPPAGLVSWWSGDGSADDISGTNDGTLSGRASFAAGMVADAFSFDGVDGYVEAGNDASVRPDFPFSVDFWIRKTDATDFFAISSTDTTGNGLYAGFLVMVNGAGSVVSGIGNDLGCCAGPFRRNHVTDPGVVQVGSWRHVAVVFESPSSHLIYVDGVPRTTTSSGSATSMNYGSGNRLQIGRVFEPNSASFVYAKGMIDEVELHVGSLDPADIQAIYQAGADGKCKPAVVMDFGDAPHPYPTAEADDGACHVVDPGILLGSAIDADEDGQPDGAAAGDDLDGIDDEDGVQFMSPLVPGDTVDLQVEASVTGLLSLWIDWDGDGSWADVHDAALADYLLSPGTNEISFVAPSTGLPGRTTYARFRFCTSPGVLWSGLAPDGEVEDYEVVVQGDPSDVSGVFPTRVALRQNVPNPFNPRTTITFTLAHDAFARVTVYTAAGRRVRQLLAEHRGPGEHTVVWDARDASGVRVASGTYLYELRVDGRRAEVRKAILSP